MYIVKGRELKCTVSREGNVWWGDREGRKEGRDKGGLREGLERRGESNGGVTGRDDRDGGKGGMERKRNGG